MGKPESVDFVDAVSYGVEMIINTIIYFLGAAIMMLIGFYVLFSAMEEMDIAFVILGFIFIFIGLLVIASLNIAIIYKIWIDVRNKSTYHTQEIYPEGPGGLILKPKKSSSKKKSV